MTKLADLSGQRFGRLSVMSRAGNAVRSNGRSHVVWNCRCDCGKTVRVPGESLRSGDSKSCGCLKRDVISARNARHGLGGTREFTAWHAMHQRCSGKAHAAYYSERGVSVCERWSCIQTFVADMGPCPSGFELDRINVNGNYEPENCRWVSRSVQAYNKRVRKTNSSGVTGVCRGRRGRWRARITVERCEYDLGEHDTFEEACRARKQAELDHFGFHPGRG